jgi:hypothetical protein
MLTGIVSALVATWLILVLQRVRLWRRSSKLVGDWDAYDFDKNDGRRLVPMQGNPKTTIKRKHCFFSIGPMNIFDISGSHDSQGNLRSHEGEMVLDPIYCQQGRIISKYKEEPGKLEMFVQQFWVIDNNTIYIIPEQPKKNDYNQHVLRRSSSQCLNA